MALKIKNERIVGIIDNLEAKLEGKLPITREELLVLVNSWGRRLGFYTKDSKNKDIDIESCEATQSEQTKFVRKECYDLSKLDTSEIIDMSDIFINSLFTDIHSTNRIGLDNGNISKWDVSNVTDMSFMFLGSKKFNSDIGKWNVSKVTNMYGMFYEAENFNQDISKWDVSNVTSMDSMFFEAKSFNQNISSWNLDKAGKCISMFYNAHYFLDKYNSGKPLPTNTNEIKEWLINNKERMNEIDIKENHGVEIDNFFDKFTNINIEANSIQKKEI